MTQKPLNKKQREKMKRLATDELTPKERARYEKIRAEIAKKFKPVIDAIEDSQRITGDDLKIVINCKG